MIRVTPVVSIGAAAVRRVLPTVLEDGAAETGGPMPTLASSNMPRRSRGRSAALLGALIVCVVLAGPVSAQTPGGAVLQSHTIPAEARQSVEQWRQTLPAEIRTVWDERTGQLLLLGPMTAHADLLRLMSGGGQASGAVQPAVQQLMAQPPVVPQPARQPAPIAQQQPPIAQQPAVKAPTVQLRRLSPEELHGRLESLSRRPLPATWDAGRTILSFPATLGEGPGVQFRVEAATGRVDIRGPAEATDAWRGVVVAMEESLAEKATPGGSQVRIVSTGDAPRDRLRTALKAIQVANPGEAAPGQAAADQAAAGQPAPPAGNAPDPLARVAEDESILGPVQIEFVDGLDVIVLRGDQEDVDRVMRIINQIETLSAETTPEIKVRRLLHIDADSLAELLGSVYQQVLGPRVGDLSVTGLAKPNALLLVGRPENVQLALGLVDQLDQPVEPTNRFEVYELKHASAADVKTLIDDYFEQQSEAGEDGASLLRSRAFVVADYRSNVVVVNAAPRDQVEVKALVQRIDAARGQAVDEVRVFPLKNSLAEDLAEVLEGAISPDEAIEDDNASPRAAALRLGAGEGDPSDFESGILTGVRVSPDTRANALVVTAPAGSMALIAALIDRLDQAPDAAAELKVFTVANGDADALASMLSTLFGSDEDSDEAGGYGSNGLSPLAITTDLRTNSIIAAGTADDLAVVEAILLRLDDDEVGSRQTTVFRLKNAESTNVAEVLNEWLDTERAAEADADLAFSPKELIEREVVIVAEPATNSLIVSATPRYEMELRRLVEQLDERPPMVSIQVLIAEVALNDTDEFGVELGLQDSLLFDRSLLSDTQFIDTTVNEQSAGGATVTTQTQTLISSELTPGFDFNNQDLGNNGSTQALARAGNVATQALSSFALSRVNSDLNFGGFVFSASSSNVSFLLRALQENRRLEVLSRPQIVTLDGQPGRSQVGARVPRITGVTQNDFGQTNVVEYEDTGIILEVTPRISPDGQVVMNVFAEKSEVGDEADGIAINIAANGDIVRAPQIASTQVETTVSAASGQTVVLTGLLTKRTFDVHRRVPLLADIPLLGDLFRYDGVEESRTELLIILTPRVIRSELDMEMLKQVESSRMSWVLSDVIDMHGPAGLRTRGDAWQETEACFPTHVPTEVEMGHPTLGEATPQPMPSEPALSEPALSEPVAEESAPSRVEAVSYNAPPALRRLPQPQTEASR